MHCIRKNNILNRIRLENLFLDIRVILILQCEDFLPTNMCMLLYTRDSTYRLSNARFKNLSIYAISQGYVDGLLGLF